MSYCFRGLWNVPYISSCYLINGTLIQNSEFKPNYIRENLDPDMAFCSYMRDKVNCSFSLEIINICIHFLIIWLCIFVCIQNVFLYVSNRMEFGHLVNPDSFDTTRTNPEIYQIFDNRWDWEQRYVHENYSENFNPNKTALQVSETR